MAERKITWKVYMNIRVKELAYFHEIKKNSDWEATTYLFFPVFALKMYHTQPVNRLIGG